MTASMALTRMTPSCSFYGGCFLVGHPQTFSPHLPPRWGNDRRADSTIHAPSRGVIVGCAETQGLSRAHLSRTLTRTSVGIHAGLSPIHILVRCGGAWRAEQRALRRNNSHTKQSDVSQRDDLSPVQCIEGWTRSRILLEYINI